MIVDRIKDGVIHSFNTETRRYLSHTTNKWVLNPRYSTAQSINNYKSKYQSRFEHLSTQYPELTKFTVFTPISITDELLTSALEKHKQDTNSNITYSIDNAKLVLDKITLTRNRYKKINNQFIPIRYTELYSKDLQYWIGSYYKFYMDALVTSEILECDNVYMNFNDTSKSYGYRINKKYLISQGDKTFKGEPLTDWQVKLRCLRNKIDLRHQIYSSCTDFKNDSYRLQMYEDAMTLFNTIDVPKFEKMMFDNIDMHAEYYHLENKTEKGKYRNIVRSLFKKKAPIEEIARRMTRIQEGVFYVNLKDEYGERFHSPFTNLPSIVRDFVDYGDEPYVEFDLVNSQMSMLSIFMEGDTVIRELLPDFVETIDDYEQKFPMSPIKEDFIENSYNGIIYNWLSEDLNIKRSTAKNYMFKTLFSHPSQYHTKRTKLYQIIPDVIDVINYLNKSMWLGDDENTSTSKLCQKTESRLMLDRVAKKLVNKSGKPFYTVHDSVSVHPKDLETLIACYNETFLELGMEPLKYKIKTHEKPIL